MKRNDCEFNKTTKGDAVMQISKRVLEPVGFIRRVYELREEDELKFYKIPYLSEYSYEIIDYILKRRVTNEENHNIEINLKRLSKHLTKRFQDEFDIENTIAFIRPITNEYIHVVVNDGLPNISIKICSWYAYTPHNNMFNITFTDNVFKQFVSFHTSKYKKRGS